MREEGEKWWGSKGGSHTSGKNPYGAVGKARVSFISNRRDDSVRVSARCRSSRTGKELIGAYQKGAFTLSRLRCSTLARMSSSSLFICDFSFSTLPSQSFIRRIDLHAIKIIGEKSGLEENAFRHKRQNKHSKYLVFQIASRQEDRWEGAFKKKKKAAWKSDALVHDCFGQSKNSHAVSRACNFSNNKKEVGTVGWYTSKEN